MIKVRILTWEDESGLSRWALMPSKVSLREAEGELMHTREAM